MLKILLTSSLLFTPLTEAPVEENKTEITLEDKNNNGIPDSIEDYYDQHIRDQYAFGISLGSLIGFASSLIGWVIILVKHNKTNKFLKTESLKTTEQVTNLNIQNERYREMLDEAYRKYEELMRDYKVLANKIIITNQEINTSLNSFSTVNDKIDTLLNTQLLFANYSEYVKENISSKIIKMVNGVER